MLLNSCSRAVYNYVFLVLIAAAFPVPIVAQQSTPSPTMTIELTLTSAQAEFEELLETNNGCELPCWWGFTVGEARVQDWFQFLDTRTFHVFREEPIGGTVVPVDYAYFSFPSSPEASVRLNYDIENAILKRIHIQLSNPRRWLSAQADAISFPGLLSRLGEELEVYIFSGSTLDDYYILVIDTSIGLIARYTFDFWEAVPANQENYPQEMALCLGVPYTKRIEITLQAPEVEPTVGTRERPIVGTQDRRGYLSVEDALFGTVSTDEFISFFREHPDECLVA